MRSGSPRDAGSELGFARLVPLRDASAELAARCAAVPSVRMPVEDAAGRIVATPVRAPMAVPEHVIALRDGWAVPAHETLGASSYAPGFASTPPRRVFHGDALPDGTDTVLPLPAVDAAASPAEIYASAAPMDGARARGGDFSEGTILLDAGDLLRPEHIPLLRLAGVSDIDVRVPSVTIVSLGCSARSESAAAHIAAAATHEGARCHVEAIGTRDPAQAALALSSGDADLVVILGDSGCGGALFRALSLAGKIIAHGLAVRPGETMGCGVIETASRPAAVPVVFVSDRIECVLAAWLLLARPCLHRLAGRSRQGRGELLPLTRKIVSAPGTSDLALLRHAVGTDATGMWEPVATSDIPWNAILHAEAWLLVPPECEGFPAGHAVFGHDL